MRQPLETSTAEEKKMRDSINTGNFRINMAHYVLINIHSNH